MPLLFIAAGLFFLIAAVRGGDNLEKAITLIKGDFIGRDSFINWLVALFAVGAIGFIKPLKPFAVALMALVVIVLLLANENKNGGGGFFTKFQQQIQS